LHEPPPGGAPATAAAAAAPPPGPLASLLRGSPYDGAIFSLAIPAVLALAADPLLQVVDTIFVGQAGPEALAALGINSALFTFSFLVFNFLATATTPLIAASLARGDREAAGKVTLQALVLGGGLGGALTVALTVGADGALALMGASPDAGGEMYSLAKEFLLIR
jgi:MATE family multidrug resistance protein